MSKKNLSNVKRGPLADCVTLHDFNVPTPEAIKGSFYYLVNFFEDYGIVPTRMGLTGPHIKLKKTTSFSNGSKILENSSFQDIASFSLYATPQNHSSDMFDSIFVSTLSASKKNKTFVLTFDDQIVSFDKITINRLASDLSGFFKPKYGYAYQRPFKKGPIWYPFGTIVDLDWDKDRQEREDITKWNHKYNLSDGSYKTGDLRDIYPMNLLSQAHQEHVVDGKPFFEWIKADPKRGTLEQLTDSLWAWWVEPEHIPEVREALRPLGWVIAI